MPKSFFQFKQFKVYHDRCAMKVGTDGVLLGAWTTIGDSAKRVLDIGTGSGLIALMLAQRSGDALHIDAIDIDNAAIEQSVFNIHESPYSNVHIYHQSLDELVAQSFIQKYEIIVSNPPYFVSSMVSPDEQRTRARHTRTLAIEDLLIHSKMLLTDSGSLSIIYPYDYRRLILELATNNDFFVKRITNVYPTPTSRPKRILFELTKTSNLTEEKDLIIELSRHVYSPDFSDLVKDFYLKL